MNKTSPKLIEKILLPAIKKEFPFVFGIQVVHRNYYSHHNYYISLGVKYSDRDGVYPKLKKYISNISPYFLNDNEELRLIELYDSTPDDSFSPGVLI
jgi:hypothetical protein